MSKQVKPAPPYRTLMIESEPTAIGNVFKVVLDLYPGLVLHSMIAVNNTRPHPVIANQQLFTAIIHAVYTLPDGGEIDQTELNAAVQAMAKAQDTPVKRIYRGPGGQA